MDIKNYLNQFINLPKMVNDMLPWNCWNACMSDSEKSIPEWINTIFKIAAVVFVLGGLFNTFKGFGDIGDYFDYGAAEGIGFILGSLFWIYVLFPISNIIRDLGEEIASSKSHMIEFVLKDIPLALIRATGYIAALLALFGAISVSFEWLTSISLGSQSVWGTFGDMLGGASAVFNIGLMAVAAMMSAFDMGIDIMDMSEMLLMTQGGFGGVEWFDFDALPMVIAAFVSVIGTLILVFVNLIIWKWVYSLGTTFVNWISGPYLPFKSLK